MLANMVTSLFDKERITTTDAKAKEARRHADRLITRAKKGYTAYQEYQSLKAAGKEAEARDKQAAALAHWRQASRVIKKQSVLKKLFDVLAPQYIERAGGYTRILHLGSRHGDSAKRVLLELVGTEVAQEPTETSKTEGRAKAKRKAKVKTKKEAKEAAEPVEAAGETDDAVTEGEPQEAPPEESTEPDEEKS